MQFPWAAIVGWFYAALLAALPWVALWRPSWAPIVAAAALVVHPPVSRTRAAEPVASLAIGASLLVFLVLHGGWEVGAGWVLLAALVAAVARALPRRDGGRPDAADLLAVCGWSVVFILAPRLVAASDGGWLAPALLLLVTLRIARFGFDRSVCEAAAPPNREVRGTLSLEGVVVAGPDGFPRSVPVDLEMRAGDSLGIVCDAPADAAGLADVLAGRARPRSGEFMIDGAPVGAEDRIVAVVAPGERFVPGDLAKNLAVLAGAPLDREAMAALRDACALGDVAEALGDRVIEADGSPLAPLHRLLLLAARVIPSDYRVLVVVDPMPWVNAVRGELWRVAVVRASVGRTSIWLTPDRDLAMRATHVMEYRQGALRSLAP